MSQAPVHAGGRACPVLLQLSVSKHCLSCRFVQEKSLLSETKVIKKLPIFFRAVAHWLNHINFLWVSIGGHPRCVLTRCLSLGSPSGKVEGHDEDRPTLHPPSLPPHPRPPLPSFSRSRPALQHRYSLIFIDAVRYTQPVVTFCDRGLDFKEMITPISSSVTRCDQNRKQNSTFRRGALGRVASTISTLPLPLPLPPPPPLALGWLWSFLSVQLLLLRPPVLCMYSNNHSKMPTSQCTRMSTSS